MTLPKCDNLIRSHTKFFAAIGGTGMHIVSLGRTLATYFRLSVVKCSGAAVDNDLKVPDFCSDGILRHLTQLSPTLTFL